MFTKKVFKLITPLEAEGYKLVNYDVSSFIYNVSKGTTDVGSIKISFKYVTCITIKGPSYIPFDLDIQVIDCSENLPLDMFKKMIMTTTQLQIQLQANYLDF